MPTTCFELPSGKTYSVNEKNQRKFTRTFIVDDCDGPGLAVNATGLLIGMEYSTDAESDSSAFLLNFNSECVSEDGRQYKVTAEYGPHPEFPDSPLDEPVEIEWSFQQFSKAIDRDIEGTAILNPALDPYADAVEIDDSRPILNITRNEASFSAALAYTYRDAINADSFQGADEGQVKVASISSSRQFDQNYGYYWKTKYTFHFNPSGWDRYILSQGTRYIDDEGKKRNILVEGVPVTEPFLLAEDGSKLPQDGQPHFKKYKVYPKLPFSAFNFD